MTLVQKEIKAVYLGDKQVWPEIVYANIDFLLVGGGGGGGQLIGTTYRSAGHGGGGGGGFIECYNYSIPTGCHSVCVGGGGSVNVKGGDTKFDGITAYGGGYGGRSACVCGEDPNYRYFNGVAGGNGGSGGGGGNANGCPATSGGSGVSGQGNNGGYGAGGGGGAGENGWPPECNYNGGAGKCSSISGSLQWYSGGGGAGGSPNTCDCDLPECRTGGRGGCGGGGNGATVSSGSAVVDSASSASYYGGGGGGGYSNSDGANGCPGYQGIVIIRYPSNCGYNITGGTKYLCNGYCIHCFTSDGTLIIN